MPSTPPTKKNIVSLEQALKDFTKGMPMQLERHPKFQDVVILKSITQAKVYNHLLKGTDAKSTLTTANTVTRDIK